MPRAKSILQSTFPYHVTARSLNKEWFKIPLDEVWEIMCRQLTYVTWAYKARIHSFVLMPNHFHLLISTPQSNLDEIMRNFMKECSFFINEKTGRINSVYGSRHFRCIIKSDHYYQNAYKYVYRNPVKSSLSKDCQSYPFSSLNFLLGDSKALCPITEDHLLFSNVESTLNWLNEEPSQEDWVSIGNAMQKNEFKIAKNPNSKKLNIMEFRLL